MDGVVCDLTEASCIGQLAEAALALWSAPPQVLVCNAGGPAPGGFDAVDDAVGGLLMQWVSLVVLSVV